MLLIVALAFILRAPYLDFGLPQRLHPDEWSQVETAWNIAQGDLNPHFFRYPTGFIYLLAVLYKTVTLVGVEPVLPTLYWLGRLVATLFGVVTTGFVVYWGWSIRGRWAGLMAGILFAIVFTPLEQSLYAVVDGPMVLWTTLALLFISLAVVQKKVSSQYWLTLGAIAIGLAVTTKYNAILLIIPLVIAAWCVLPSPQSGTQRWLKVIELTLGVGLIVAIMGTLLFTSQQSRILTWFASLTTDGHLEQEYLSLYAQFTNLLWLGSGLILLMLIFFKRTATHPLWLRFLHPHLFLYAGLIALIFALVSPFVLIEWRTAMRDFFFEMRHMRIGAGAYHAEGSTAQLKILSSQAQFLPSASHYWRLIMAEFGWLAALLAVIGWVYLWSRSRYLVYSLLPYVAIQFLILASWNNWATRYLLPLYPVIALLAGIGVAGIIGHLATRQKKQMLLVTASVILLVVLGQPASHTYRQLRQFALPDTRELAHQWAAQNVPPQARIVYDDKTPDFEMTSPPFYAQKASTIYFLEELSTQDLIQGEFTYIFTTFTPDSLLASTDTTIAQRYDAFLETYEKVAVFEPKSSQSTGRPVYVYKLRSEISLIGSTKD